MSNTKFEKNHSIKIKKIFCIDDDNINYNKNYNKKYNGVIYEVFN